MTTNHIGHRPGECARCDLADAVIEDLALEGAPHKRCECGAAVLVEDDVRFKKCARCLDAEERAEIDYYETFVKKDRS
jgi:hypothetical protein